LPNLPEQRMETSHYLQDVVMYLVAAVHHQIDAGDHHMEITLIRNGWVE
jgi:flavin reductase (DIM6/NTAB) family NADH-FMN oxidoreductase RutF